MKVLSLTLGFGLILASLTSLIYSSVIPEQQDANEEYLHSISNSESIANDNLLFSKELESIMLQKHLPVDEDEIIDTLIIPKHLINIKVLNSLGLRNIVKNSKKFKLNNKAFETNLEILVPDNVIPFFLFNTSDSLNIPKEKTRVEYAKFIDNSIPFNLPEFISLIDYYLILPIPKNFNINSVHEGIILTSKNHLSIFKQSLSTNENNQPLLVFMFRSGNDVFNAKEFNLPLIKIKNYLGNNHLQSFFDIFAKNWINDVNYSQLVNSVFCTLNIDMFDKSFCVKVKPDSSSLSLFPAYNLESKNEKRNDYEFRELTLPLSIIKDVDNDNLSNIDKFQPRTKSYSQISSKPETLRMKTKQSLLKRSKNSKTSKYSKEQISNIQKQLNNELKIKNQKYKNLKEIPGSYVVSNILNKNDSPAHKSKKSTEKKLLLEKVNKAPHSIETSHIKNNKTIIDHNNKIYTTNTEASISTSKKEKEKDCVPITWFNVFHHSIYNDQNFCGIKK